MRKDTPARSISRPYRIQESSWDVIGSFPPHKIFLWDDQGTYLDCEFPNPVFGHFLGGAMLCGKNIKAVLPLWEYEVILMAIRQAMTTHNPMIVCIELMVKTCRYKTLIRILPMRDYVIGWVNDFPMQENPQSNSQSNENAKNLNPRPLTSQEKEVCKWIFRDKSNLEIAQLSCISERTVKFHISNLFSKLQVSSRAQLKLVIPFLLDFS